MVYKVHIIDTEQSFEVQDGESILDAAQRTQVKMAHECQFGGCGTCRIKLIEGQVQYEEFPMGLTDEEHAQGYALACQARPLSDIVLSAAGKQAEFAEPVQVTARVVSVKPFTPDIVHLVLEPEDIVAYLAGQYVNLLLEDGSTRSFSMASSLLPNGYLDFHIRRIPGGRFTDKRLLGLSPGSSMSIEAPLGTFCYHEEDWRPLIMVATGTGIAPIKAILESLLDNEDCPPVSLYWGMRTEQDLYLAQEIASWQDRLYEFTFVPVLSGPGPGWTGRRGYVQQAVAQDHPDLSEHAIYLCGSPDMIVQAKSLFAQHGASLDHCYADSFTFQSQAALVA